jgi:hypothetical protein
MERHWFIRDSYWIINHCEFSYETAIESNLVKNLPVVLI